MPVYEYQCTKCGVIEEALQKISDPPLVNCSHCEGRLKKLISQSAFHLKGSGWYVTDYGGAKNGAPQKSDEAVKTKSKDKTATSKKATDPKK